MGQQRHTAAEIAGKLGEADALIAEGKLNRDVAKALGVSVMTYHRWRKTRNSSPLLRPFQPGGAQKDGSPTEPIKRIRELQLENARLRRLVTDLLLEKIDTEEAMHGRSADVGGGIRR
jgi:transposase